MNRKHVRFYSFVRPLVILFLKLRFGYTYETAKNLPNNYIVISNHVTDYDMLLAAASFPRQMYFVASEHVARWKLLWRILEYAFAPIIRPKGASGAATTMEMIRKARKGDNVCLFAEGVRTWDGVTCPIVPATGKLVKSAGCGLVTYKIKGGYFASPMWAGASVRRGYLHGAPVNVYTPEQLKEMTAAQVQEAIERDVYEDAYDRQRRAPRRYRSKKTAEGLENLLFVCPQCGEYDSFRTRGDTVTCGCCGMEFAYTEYGMLERAPFETLREFSLWQREQVAEAVTKGIVFRGGEGLLNRLENHTETPVAQGTVTMDGGTLRCGAWAVPMSAVTDLAMCGQRSIVFTAEKQYYELRPARGSNVLKFLWYFEELKKRQQTRVKRG